MPPEPSTDDRMVIFVRTFDFLAWLLPMTNHFPRAHRHSLTRRPLDAALDLRERLEEANHRRGAERRRSLDRADESLAKVRLYLRLAFHFQWLTKGQYFSLRRPELRVGYVLPDEAENGGAWSWPRATLRVTPGEA